MTTFGCRTCCVCVDAASQMALMHSPQGAADGPSSVTQLARETTSTDDVSACRRVTSQNPKSRVKSFYRRIY